MTYARRYIDVTFSGGSAGEISFKARGKYALRTSARVLHAGGYNLSELQLEIRGLSLQHILQLSTYGTIVHPNYNYKVQVDAGDEVNGMSTIFVGNIQQAWADMRAMPDCPFHVMATSGGQAAAMKAEPSSFQGPTPATTILQQIAGKAKLGFQNFGLQSMLADPYHWGSPWKQIREVLDAAHAEGHIANDTLSVYPVNGSVGGNLVISPGTGLRDYPSFTEYGVQVRYEFHRAIEYRSIMTIEGSQIVQANGPWTIIRIDYDLQANWPHGNWFAVLDGYNAQGAAGGQLPVP